MKKKSKKERQKELLEMLEKDCFYTDEELASYFEVSIQTIRLDRLQLGIPELRERVKNLAESNLDKVKTIKGKEILGELITLEVGSLGISILETTEDMTYSKTNIIKGHYIFAQAESLAMAVIDAPVVLMGVANIKNIDPVRPNDRLIAKAEVVRVRNKKHYVHVKINNKNHMQVFRGKFIFDEIS
ncbi:Acyl-coenzyme A thioesterase PaaI, contains HGG motif [Alkalithermobacter thermoalcaliphilus JW-YL-7 = DSM 7308]|uniref:Acyl-coenzyme A thioesterase PaaI, contains HGG motif n=1 Tax=Alkalithermobacter thermoalcaliphilus JW-YL-7 = DSM 7308 TaxID=1121328 RepID=A0A150FPR8_CLOPD|nr:regulatory protein DeoR [[Clostridium] paradoxum JW-YL-7 = DSM 7308]SHK95499.1 Acyl-coenzyme A thioesterase PaaI, contains HGG motif [[Clostridium] paradoxum JW-YL-7 = DSM 7308]